LEWDTGDRITYGVNLERFNDKGEEQVLAVFVNYYAEDHTGQKKDINSMFPLVMTPCNFGKHRYWFLCPGIVEGKFCLRRSAVLYKPPLEECFACRKCWSLSYASQNIGGYQKKIGRPLSATELEEMEMSITKRFYKGLPTKRYAKYLRKCKQFCDYREAWHENFMKRNKKWIK
jgi:hypothetical protein